MLRLCTLAGLIAAAHADGPRRFLQSTTCVEGALRLFAFGTPANEYFVYPYSFGATVASQQIFAEAPPEPGDFQQYAESEYPTIATQGPIGTNFDGNVGVAVSSYWYGKATTIDNDWYDVKARRGVQAWR